MSSCGSEKLLTTNNDIFCHFIWKTWKKKEDSDSTKLYCTSHNNENRFWLESQEKEDVKVKKDKNNNIIYHLWKMTLYDSLNLLKLNLLFDSYMFTGKSLVKIRLDKHNLRYNQYYLNLSTHSRCGVQHLCGVRQSGPVLICYFGVKTGIRVRFRLRLMSGV